MEQKTCKYCGKTLTRRENHGKVEAARDFRRRSFCDKKCASKFQHSGDETTRAIKAAKVEIKTGTEEEQRTAAEILGEAMNNLGLDWTTRINAAKALLPYQNNRGDKVSKKGEQAEAAKNAAAGKFSAGAAPKVVQLKKQG